MNPALDRLHRYPFQKLAALLEGVTPPQALAPIALHIGEPGHATPAFIKDTLAASLDGLANYPTTQGGADVRTAIADWLTRRHGLAGPGAEREVLPVNGSREALFACAQAVVDRGRASPVVVMPNPFYQIYEGAALLAGAQPQYLNTVAANNYALDLGQLDDAVWQRTQIIYVCSPDNPTGHVMSLEEWRALFELSDRHGFVIASDECYSELYFDEAAPPLGALGAAQQLGRGGWPNLLVFGSLSKRSNVPGLRSGFVAGDAALIEKFLLYRTYHGCSMSPPVQAASTAAWRDETHVAENRRLYREKFAAAVALLGTVADVRMPEASFYLWLDVAAAGGGAAFAQGLYAKHNVKVLPGAFLSREARGVNPGADYVRIALVPDSATCLEGVRRIAAHAAETFGREPRAAAHSRPTAKTGKAA